MKMRYLRLQLSFLLNNYVLIIILIFTFLLDFGIIFDSGIFYGYGTIDMLRAENYKLFLIDSVRMIKISGIIFSVIVAALSSSDRNQNLAIYVVQEKAGKLYFIISRFIAVFIITFSFYFTYWIFYIAFSKGFLPYIIDYDAIKQIFFKLLLQAGVYIVIAMVLSELIRSFFVVVLPLIIFWIMEGNALYEAVKSNKLLWEISRVFPHIVLDGNKFILVHGYMNHFLVLIMLILSLITMFLANDVK